MSPIPMWSIPGPQTGTSVLIQLGGQAEYRSGMREPPFVARVSNKSRSLRTSTQTNFFEQEESVTDPNAQKRVIDPYFPDMVRNLAQLALVAKAMVPDLRDMTAAERSNLRRYYRKLYRKA